MALLKYFKTKETPLPNSNGSLVEIVPPTSIAMAYREVKPLLKNASTSGTNKPVKFHWRGEGQDC